jgi:GNAT superfamily N-acetyltransferase
MVAKPLRHHRIGPSPVLCATVRGCPINAQRLSVTAYAANQEAQHFYARHGFTPRSVVLDRDVPA